MDGELSGSALIRALAWHDAVVSDPMRHGPATAALVTEARAHIRSSVRSAAGPAEVLVVTLRTQAVFERARLAHDAARRMLGEAARIAQRIGATDRLHDVLLARAAVHLELGQFTAARRDIERATELRSGAVDPDRDLQHASLLYNVGRLDEAARLCRRILDGAAVADTEARVANNLALIEAQLGRPHAALALLDRAERLAGPALAALVACSRGWVLARSGRLIESMTQFAEAADRYRSAGLPLGELQMEQLDALVDLRLIDEARTLAHRAVDGFAAGEVALMGAEAQLRLARVLLLGGAADAAGAAARRARDSFRAQRRAGWAARAAVVVAEADGADADLAALRRAVRVLRRDGPRAVEVDAQLTAGRLAVVRGRRDLAGEHFRAAHEASRGGATLGRLRGRLAAALLADLDDDRTAVLRHARLGLADLARHRDGLGSSELRALASGHGVELGTLALRAVRTSGTAADVLRWLDRTTAAALIPTAAQPGPEVQARLAVLTAVQGELEQARDVDGHEPPALIAAQAAAETDVRQASWRAAGGSRSPARALPLDAVRRLLDPRAMAVFGSDRGALFVVLVSATRTRMIDLGPAAAVRAESDALLFALRRLTRPGPAAALRASITSARHALDVLRRTLVEPLRLGPTTPLVVVPDGTTRTVPWSAVHAGPVAVAPSMSVWARSLDVTAGDAALLVAGPGLPGAIDEVRAIAGVLPGAHALLPPDSTVDAVVAALPRAGLAHLACHGLLRADNPTFSALRLTGGDLTLHQLDLLGSAPHRVVLAACGSATGVGYDGGEILGFVGALMSRGTGGVVANTAPVGDLESVPLMRALHERLRDGATCADAVHAARAVLDPDHPREFVLRCATTAFGAA